MSPGPLPEFVDAYQVFAHQAHISALVPLERFQRFGQYLFNEQPLPEQQKARASVEIELDFSRDASAYRTVTGHISTVVTLKCQRCLQALVHALEIAPDLIVEDSEQKASQIEDDREIVLTRMREEQRVLDLLDLIEDELILGLPLVPRHDEGECEALPVRPVDAPGTGKRSITGGNTGIHDKLLALKASLAKSGPPPDTEDND